MRRRFDWKYPFWISFIVVFCILLVISYWSSKSSGTSPSPPVSVMTPPPAAPTPLPVVTYHVSGKQILDNHGRVFVPYGVHLIGLFAYGWRNSPGSQQLTFLQMKKAHNVWHANTVGLQVASANLFTDYPSDTSYNHAYLEAVDQEVTWAHWEGMNILLILQYEATLPQPLPTEESVKFWNFMSLHYRHNPWVFFDVFNEPVSPSGLTEDQTWPLWQHGGEYEGVFYVGMQDLVNTIRGNGAKNLIFIDGLAAGEDLRGVPTYHVNGKNIIYAIHPYLGSQHESKQDWDSWFGNVATKADFPVVADEWNASQLPSECILQAPTLVPQLLDYLNALHIGLIAWALFPGLLIRGWNYDDPTAFDQPTFLCNAPFPNYDSLAQGAGKLLLRYFAAHASSG